MAGPLTVQGWVRPPSLALCADECGAKCCKNRLVLLTPGEATRLSSMGHAPITQGTNGRWAMLTIPTCVFLTTENLCRIYAERPEACRVFPQRPASGCLVWPKDLVHAR